MANMTEVDVTTDQPPTSDALMTNVRRWRCHDRCDRRRRRRRRSRTGDGETVGDIRAMFMHATSTSITATITRSRTSTLEIGKNEVIALIGPSGCGKSTFLRCLNRMNDTIESARVTGKITLDGEDIYTRSSTSSRCARASAWCSRSRTRSPRSIYDNVAYGPRIHGLAADRAELDEIVHNEPRARGPVGRGQGPARPAGHRALRRAAAATVHRARHRRQPGGHPHGRALLGARPDRDGKVEDLIDELRSDYAIVIVTHSMQQAARVSQRTAYFHLGLLVEVDETDRIFTNPQHKLTEDYITGRVDHRARPPCRGSCRHDRLRGSCARSGSPVDQFSQSMRPAQRSSIWMSSPSSRTSWKRCSMSRSARYLRALRQVSQLLIPYTVSTMIPSVRVSQQVVEAGLGARLSHRPVSR